jgi:glutathione S-transferase
MSSLKPLIFFDIPAKASLLPLKSWGPNTWKARYVLNLYAVPYTTTWVEYPDIESTLKPLRIKPTTTRFGKDLYTLPALIDPNTDTRIADSQLIAEYIDSHYSIPPPHTAITTTLFPPGSRGLQLAFANNLNTIRAPHTFRLLIPAVLNNILNEASRPYFRSTRERVLGTTPEPLESLVSSPEKRAALVKATADSFNTLAKYYDADAGLFIMGDKMCFADIELASLIKWMRIADGEGEGSAWAAVAELDGGRWVRFSDAFKPYETDD